MTLQVKKRILIVEDMGNWREALVTILQNKYEIVLSKTYNEAIAELQNNTFNLVILDVRLEDQDKFNIQGLELLRLIKDSYSDVPVVILTGHPESILPQTLENYKPDDLLLKESLDIDIFMDKISELL